MRILIDGDACPVVDSVIRLTTGSGVLVYIYRSFDHFSNQVYPEHVKTHYVDGGRDAVDFSIIQNVQSQDIVITQDYGLASLLLNKAQHVIHHNGRIYTQSNIDQLLAQRYFSQQERRKKHRHSKGPKPFNERQRKHFESQLSKLLKITI
ncbi:YaiI/YqxD family protein [Staphylococcus sp. H16/1A]|uniref:UPF0178 protein HHH54_00140 n=2 Tax=Staphylococcus canis TaxID=2724942 RepID=A0ABS0T6K7_9STAP|nr:YaiI/YqxD family protein [Staphylococcus canis]MBI5974002.1 YaiI/YqxD family protein [Staphylococcus canis]